MLFHEGTLQKIWGAIGRGAICNMGEYMTGHGTSWRQDTIRTCEKMVGGGVNMELQYGGVQLTSLKTGENMSVKILSPLVCL